MKPTLKAPGSERLKLKCDEALSNFAFNYHSRRYDLAVLDGRDGSTPLHLVSRCKLNRCKPTLKAPGTKRLNLKYDELLSVSTGAATTWQPRTVRRCSLNR
jgi:hypothetical protein